MLLHHPILQGGILRYLINKVEDLDIIRDEIEEAKIIGYDYETYVEESSYEKVQRSKRPIDMLRSQVAGVSYGFKKNSYYVNVGHTDAQGITIDDISVLNRGLVGDKCS